MGLVTRKNDRLEKLFDGFAVDPSKLRSAQHSDKKKNRATDKQNKDNK